MMALQLRDFDAEFDQANATSDTDFSDIPVEPEIPVYSFTEEELGKMLADARQQGAEEGHASGLEEGRREAMADLQAQANMSLELLSAQLADLEQQDAIRRAELEGDLVSMVLEIAERFVPTILETLSADQVQSRVTQAIAMAPRRQELTISLAPEVKDILGPELKKMAQMHSGLKPKLVADPDLKNGEAQVEWDNGFMTYSLDQICAELLDALRTASSTLNPQPEKV